MQNKGVIGVYKKTQDDWRSNYKVVGDVRVSDLVEVSYIPLIQGNYRVSVWGNDDGGWEYDTDSFGIAMELFLEIIGLEFVNIEDMIRLEMYPA